MHEKTYTWTNIFKIRYTYGNEMKIFIDRHIHRVKYIQGGLYTM